MRITAKDQPNGRGLSPNRGGGRWNPLRRAGISAREVELCGAPWTHCLVGSLGDHWRSTLSKIRGNGDVGNPESTVLLSDSSTHLHAEVWKTRTGGKHRISFSTQQGPPSIVNTNILLTPDRGTARSHVPRVVCYSTRTMSSRSYFILVENLSVVCSTLCAQDGQ
jgi:hypothetical protein